MNKSEEDYKNLGTSTFFATKRPWLAFCTVAQVLPFCRCCLIVDPNDSNVSLWDVQSTCTNNIKQPEVSRSKFLVPNLWQPRVTQVTCPSEARTSKSGSQFCALLLGAFPHQLGFSLAHLNFTWPNSGASSNNIQHVRKAEERSIWLLAYKSTQRLGWNGLRNSRTSDSSSSFPQGVIVGPKAQGWIQKHSVYFHHPLSTLIKALAEESIHISFHLWQSRSDRGWKTAEAASSDRNGQICCLLLQVHPHQLILSLAHLREIISCPSPSTTTCSLNKLWPKRHNFLISEEIPVWVGTSYIERSCMTRHMQTFNVIMHWPVDNWWVRALPTITIPTPCCQDKHKGIPSWSLFWFFNHQPSQSWYPWDPSSKLCGQVFHLVRTVTAGQSFCFVWTISATINLEIILPGGIYV